MQEPGLRVTFPQRGYPQPAHGELRGEGGEGELWLGHRTLLPPSCHLVQKRAYNVDAPLGPEQDLKLLFPCNPKDPLLISIKIRLDYMFFAVL